MINHNWSWLMHQNDNSSTSGRCYFYVYDFRERRQLLQRISAIVYNIYTFTTSSWHQTGNSVDLLDHFNHGRGYSLNCCSRWIFCETGYFGCCFDPSSQTTTREGEDVGHESYESSAAATRTILSILWIRESLNWTTSDWTSRYFSHFIFIDCINRISSGICPCSSSSIFSFRDQVLIFLSLLITP